MVCDLKGGFQCNAKHLEAFGISGSVSIFGDMCSISRLESLQDVTHTQEFDFHIVVHAVV